MAMMAGRSCLDVIVIAVVIRIDRAVALRMLNSAIMAVRSPQQAACCGHGKAENHTPEKKYDQASGKYAHGLYGLPDE
ncbi:hypothetical protein DSCW_35200 [Desulfosarcina widdelii]|uniref:Uncharacterized protein n=1 Tax=Desulfosarcina widdelii TaxID=947919 RepID=A0A5K7Z8B5_9BACT|nr:hypothetical protein DSCW_35200 [Desulfosarcina widdelii]